MTSLFDSVAPLFELSRDVERMLGARESIQATFLPAADVIVTDDDVMVTMDVPGLRAEDLSIELHDDTLTVRGERPYPYADGAGDGQHRAWRRIERGFGKFERVLRVTKGLDPDSITASLNDGVLTLLLPKPQEQRPRRIEINAGHQDKRELEGATA
jgi:HSP20 family protein